MRDIWTQSEVNWVSRGDNLLRESSNENIAICTKLSEGYYAPGEVTNFNDCWKESESRIQGDLGGMDCKVGFITTKSFI